MTPYGRWSARVYSLLIDPLLRALRAKITEIVVEEGITTALDIACATGAQCRSLQRAGIAATGVDLSEAMIATAMRISPPQVRYVIGSALDLPFPAGAFTAAILSLCLHEHPFSEQEKMVKEALRVISPGGVLILAEYSPPTRPTPTWMLINLIERLAGKEHFRNFRAFVRAGGVNRLLRFTPQPERRVPIFGGTITVIVAKKPLDT